MHELLERNTDGQWGMTFQTLPADGLSHEEDHLRGADGEGGDEMAQSGQGQGEAAGGRLRRADERRHDAEPQPRDVAEPRQLAGAPAPQVQGQVGGSAERPDVPGAGSGAGARGHVPCGRPATAAQARPREEESSLVHGRGH